MENASNLSFSLFSIKAAQRLNAFLLGDWENKCSLQIAIIKNPERRHGYVIDVFFK